MIRPINVSDTSFQGKGLKLRQTKKVARQVVNLGKVESKTANNLKGVAKTPVRFGYVFNDNDTMDDASVGSGQATLVFSALGFIGTTSS